MGLELKGMREPEEEEWADLVTKAQWSEAPQQGKMPPVLGTPEWRAQECVRRSLETGKVSL